MVHLESYTESHANIQNNQFCDEYYHNLQAFVEEPRGRWQARWEEYLALNSF